MGASAIQMVVGPRRRKSAKSAQSERSTTADHKPSATDEADEFLAKLLESREDENKLFSLFAGTDRRVIDSAIRLIHNAERGLRSFRKRGVTHTHAHAHELQVERLGDHNGHQDEGVVARVHRNPSKRRERRRRRKEEEARPHEQAGVSSELASRLPEWEALRAHWRDIEPLHLRDLLADEQRSEAMLVEHEGMLLDYSRQRATAETVQLLLELARAADLPAKIQAMARGDEINLTERRPALHMALRKPAGEVVEVGGVDVVEQVHAVRRRVDAFAERVRSGEHRGATGKLLKNVVVVGIGGSSLGPAFVFEALKATPLFEKVGDRQVRFLANIDEVDTARAIAQLDAAETLVVVTSKSFTTRETLINACTLRQWLVEQMGWEGGALASHITRQHIVACTGDVEAAECWGVNPELAFPFWDWVGGRYSVTSCVGQLPVALAFGPGVFDDFLAGCHAMDEHFTTAPMEANLPVMLGMLGVWNSNFLGYRSRGIFPYCEALWRLPAHIQQVDMESNGKRVTVHGEPLDYFVGEVDFGEAGTTGQHSFFQLVHMGQTVPADFIGFVESPLPELYHETVLMEGAAVSHHDELMANFFAQPDALACGLTEEQLEQNGIDPALVPHRIFPGNRPSTCLLVQKLTPYSAGQILALYEHRTAVQGFVWGINSFDQWGVELGKTLATDLRRKIQHNRRDGSPPDGLNPSTTRLLSRYLATPRPTKVAPSAQHAAAPMNGEQASPEHDASRVHAAEHDNGLGLTACVSDDQLEGCSFAET